MLILGQRALPAPSHQHHEDIATDIVHPACLLPVDLLQEEDGATCRHNQEF